MGKVWNVKVEPTSDASTHYYGVLLQVRATDSREDQQRNDANGTKVAVIIDEAGNLRTTLFKNVKVLNTPTINK